MSIDHSFRFKQNGIEWILTITGLNESDKSLDDISFHLGILSLTAPPMMMTLSREDMCNLYEFLDVYPFLKDPKLQRSGNYCRSQPDEQHILSLLQQTDKQEATELIKKFIEHNLSKSDVDLILGRKEALSNFEQMLQSETPEPKWQHKLKFLCGTTQTFGNRYIAFGSNVIG